MVRNCPVSQAAKIVGRTWTMELIYFLQEPRRFCELQALVGGVNPATLTKRLRMLVKEGMIKRNQISWGQRHVEYDLTEKGRGILPALRELVTWGHRWNGGAEDTLLETSQDVQSESP